jgi:hypothetical protein
MCSGLPLFLAGFSPRRRRFPFPIPPLATHLARGLRRSTVAIARVLVFGATTHLSAMPMQFNEGAAREMVPFGVYARDHFGARFLNIVNLISGGEIVYCSAHPPRLMPLKPPLASAIESLFASINIPRYVVDLRTAPPPVAAWLRAPQQSWACFAAFQYPLAAAFDLAYFVSPISSVCVAH